MAQNTIAWFEIYVSDIERAKKFYHAVLGTKFYDMPPPLDSPPDMKMAFFSPPEESSAVSGALIEMKGTKEGDNASINTIVYFPSADCAVEESRVESAGGKVHSPKKSIGEYGFISLCLDTEDNMFGLFSMK